MMSAKPIMAMLATLALVAAAVSQDKTREQRIADLIGQLASEENRERAVEALASIGTPAVSFLLIELDRPDEETGPLLRSSVLEALGRMRGDADSAVPFLMEYLHSAPLDTVIAALRALADLAPYSNPAERDVMQRRDFLNLVVDRISFQTTGRLRERNRFFHRIEDTADAGLSTEHFIATLKANREYGRVVAAEVLATRGPEALATIPILHDALKHPDRVERGSTKTGFQGHPDQDGFPGRAAEAMILLAPRDPRTALAYAYQLSAARSASERLDAIAGIMMIGPQDADAVPALLRAAEDRDSTVAHEAITTLGVIGPPARGAIHTLEKLSNHTDPQIAERAKAALRQVRG